MRNMKTLALATLAMLSIGAPALAQSQTRTIDLTDLKLDIDDMQGQTVKVTGLLQVIGDMVMLKSEPMDMSPVMVNAKQLSRDDRKLLLNKCPILCKATVVGKVDEAASFGSPGLQALNLENVTGFNMNLF
jgi:hypothetical protein